VLLAAIAADPQLACRLRVAPAEVLAGYDLSPDELAELDRRLRDRGGVSFAGLFGLDGTEASFVISCHPPSSNEEH